MLLEYIIEQTGVREEDAQLMGYGTMTRQEFKSKHRLSDTGVLLYDRVYAQPIRRYRMESVN